jgi:hypothetical protein
MAEFLKHIGCDSCGSSDAKAVYSDQSTYCFSCGTYTGTKITPYAVPKEDKKQISLPSDCNQEYSQPCVEWITKYNLSVKDLLNCHNPIYYSKQREQLIFSWEDEEGNPLAYQARNLFPVSKGKRYYTCGDVNNLLPIYYTTTRSPRSLVLVEDCLSALKCSSPLTGLQRDSTGEQPLGCDSMPLLGSGITNKKLSQLRPFYDVLWCFLDPDMYHKSLDIAKRAQMLGFRASVIKAEADPKELSYKQLYEVLK